MKKIDAEDLEIILLEGSVDTFFYGICKKGNSQKNHEGTIEVYNFLNSATVCLEGDLFEVSEFHLFAFEKPGQNYAALRRLIILYANAFWESLTWLKENDKEENRRERGDCEY